MSDSDHGYFANSGEEMELEETAEEPDSYQPGKYYPISIGEILVDRYRIEHKLGYSGYSVVWIAYDLLEKKTVALKVIIVDRTAENDFIVQQQIV